MIRLLCLALTLAAVAPTPAAAECVNHTFDRPLGDSRALLQRCITTNYERGIDIFKEKYTDKRLLSGMGMTFALQRCDTEYWFHRSAFVACLAPSSTPAEQLAGHEVEVMLKEVERTHKDGQ